MTSFIKGDIHYVIETYDRRELISSGRTEKLTVQSGT